MLRVSRADLGAGRDHLPQSRTPLVKWFLAIYLITSSKNDIASLELARQLGVKWDTAWLIKQKLMEVMRQRNATYKLGAMCRSMMGIWAAKSPEKRGEERPTRSLSS